MSTRITVGIDIGTYEVRVIVAEQQEGNLAPTILGTGRAESKGMRHGYITNNEDVSSSVALAVRQAEKSSGQKIRKGFISIGGVGLSGINSNGSTIVSRADQEITEVDVEQALSAAEEAIPSAALQNRKIIYSIPTAWKIDGKPVLGRVVGMKGVKLEVKALFISCLEPHLSDLVTAVENAGVEAIDVVASPIAASLATLSKSRKIAGCILANIGAETLSIMVFENDMPISLEVFPIGGSEITNDIALGLKISLEEAESIKLGGITGTNYSKKKLEDIISARLGDMFDLIQNHLKKIGKAGILPAGIILTGGSSAISNIEDLARNYLGLPARISLLNFGGGLSTGQAGKFQIKDSTWAVAYGLCVIGNVPDDEESLGLRKQGKNLFKKMASFLKQFLP